ncbi:MAG: hypothetical protein JWM38_2487 [Sphingomonas bacterium]|nr:hypothetical protein [Sphingomonas bacterium]
MRPATFRRYPQVPSGRVIVNPGDLLASDKGVGGGGDHSAGVGKHPATCHLSRPQIKPPLRSRGISPPVDPIYSSGGASRPRRSAHQGSNGHVDDPWSDPTCLLAPTGSGNHHRGEAICPLTWKVDTASTQPAPATASATGVSGSSPPLPPHPLQGRSRRLARSTPWRRAFVAAR